MVDAEKRLNTRRDSDDPTDDCSRTLQAPSRTWLLPPIMTGIGASTLSNLALGPDTRHDRGRRPPHCARGLQTSRAATVPHIERQDNHSRYDSSCKFYRTIQKRTVTVYPRRSANRVPNRSLSQAAHGAHLYLTPWSSCRIPGRSSSPPGEEREPCSKTITPWTGEKWEGIIRARIRSALLWCLPIFLQTIQGMIVLPTKSLIHTLGDEVLAGGSASRTRIES